MENKEMIWSMVQELRVDCARKQKKGLHFIIASIWIWVAILGIQMSSLPDLTKNLYTFCCSVPLMPLAYLISKWLRVDFQNKDNPLTGLGLLFSLNQMLYILIAMWVYSSVPDKMLMVYAMIFGAHLLPYGWLYQSKTYYVLAVLIPIAALAVGVYCSAVAVAGMMLVIEVIFTICLVVENRKN